jgi:hypothetical protein
LRASLKPHYAAVSTACAVIEAVLAPAGSNVSTRLAHAPSGCHVAASVVLAQRVPKLVAALVARSRSPLVAPLTQQAWLALLHVLPPRFRAIRSALAFVTLRGNAQAENSVPAVWMLEGRTAMQVCWRVFPFLSRT